MEDFKNKPDSYWRETLTPEQYRVLREQGTERAFTGVYATTKKEGVYHCAGCHQPLFSSETKYESGTGWPSFWQPLSKQAVETKPDSSHGMNRIEVKCGFCGGHLGHLFDDGPAPTHQRYCLNSAALELMENQKK